MTDTTDKDPLLEGLRTQGNCQVTRNAFGYELRPSVAYQSGHGTQAPALMFADADTQLGEGGKYHEDGKYVNEPAIVYVRADGYLRQAARIAQLEATLEKADALAGSLGNLRPWDEIDANLEAYRKARGKV